MAVLTVGVDVQRHKCYRRQSAWAEKSGSGAEPPPDPVACLTKEKEAFTKLCDLLGVY